jgi:hypothetical protein
MARAIAAISGSAAALLPHPALPPAFSRFLRELARDLFDPYRPERHYMRGPGPAWRKKNESNG